MGKAIAVEFRFNVESIDSRSGVIVGRAQLVDDQGAVLMATTPQRIKAGDSFIFTPCWLAMNRQAGDGVNVEVIFEIDEKPAKKKKDPAAGYPTATPIDVKGS